MTGPRDTEKDNAALPLAREELVVDKVDNVFTVRVSTRTLEENVEVSETLNSIEAEITRMPVDRYIDEVPDIENRDGVTVLPVVEEILVKRLVLREEVHVLQVASSRPHNETVTLRSQHPVAERLDERK